MAESNSTARTDRRDDLFDRCIATVNLISMAFHFEADALRDNTMTNAAYALQVDLDELRELVEAEGGAS